MHAIIRLDESQSLQVIDPKENPSACGEPIIDELRK